MKLYIVWDMEGCSGLFTRDQAWYWHPGASDETAEAGRRLLMADADSASAAALAAGVDELIICATHHGNAAAAAAWASPELPPAAGHVLWTRLRRAAPKQAKKASAPDNVANSSRRGPSIPLLAVSPKK